MQWMQSMHTRKKANSWWLLLWTDLWIYGTVRMVIDTLNWRDLLILSNGSLGGVFDKHPAIKKLCWELLFFFFFFFFFKYEICLTCGKMTSHETSQSVWNVILLWYITNNIWHQIAIFSIYLAIYHMICTIYRHYYQRYW